MHIIINCMNLIDNSFYKSTEWKRLRRVILRRDGYACQECRRYGRMRGASHVHHINPVEHFPELARKSWNLVSLCQECHNAMHDRDTHELSTRGEELRCKTNQRIAQRSRNGSDGTTAE